MRAAPAHDDALLVHPAALRGEVVVPGDKSLSHRSLLFAALAAGRSELDGLLQGGDAAATVGVLRALGVDVFDSHGRWTVEGGGPDALREPAAVLDCVRSGTTMRLLAGLLAGLPVTATLSGDPQLLGRPMRRIIEPLRQMGVRFLGRASDAFAPFTMRGPRADGRALRSIDYQSPVASAQVKSAILLAGLHADGVTTVREPGLSRDHSERMLLALGAPIRIIGERSGRFVVQTNALARPLDPIVGRIPGDPSSAAFPLAAAAMQPGAEVVVRDVALNPTRVAFLDVLRAAGAEVEVVQTRDFCGEPVGDIAVRGRALRAFEVGAAQVPALIDEIPVLAVVAAMAEGVSAFRDAAELRVKETDRIATTAAGLAALGAAVTPTDDGMVVQGRAGRPFVAAPVQSFGDHRIAMAMAVAVTCADGPVRIAAAGCSADSFPGFAETLAALGVEATWITDREAAC
ncbi:MAG: 3-phosphoshikimate 1-carboxyvinyltransferase [Deltaproteobacteria bacterium]|nr:3-phosphoshikimate 1-carboxyvinyltransferase [Deltaproteobacteria bacterium]